jgi:glycerophosphoryl diester phosphodiesterase
LGIAHRGGAALMPENSFPAFDNAVRLGADMLEFDIEMTADDGLIISHDGTVNPTFCAADPGSGVTPGPVRALTVEQLRKFDCGSRHRGIYPGQTAVPGTRMPTLDALLARYRREPVRFYGETKMPGPGEGRVAASIRKYELEDRFIVQSSDYRTIDAIHAVNPRIRTCLLTPWLANSDYLELVRRHHASCILLRVGDADAAEARRLRDAGIMIVSDVVDNEAGWSDYLARGVDALFTNDPAALIAYLNRGPRLR